MTRQILRDDLIVIRELAFNQSHHERDISLPGETTVVREGQLNFFGVVFVNDAGYLGMCGHGSIGLATTAVAMGMVKAVEPYTTIKLDTTVGLVECKVRVEGGKPKSVTITNVPSFLYRQRVVVPVCGFGKVAVDIAYGGNWFGFVEADQLGLTVEKGHLPVLMQAATAIREALRAHAPVVLGTLYEWCRAATTTRGVASRVKEEASRWAPLA